MKQIRMMAMVLMAMVAVPLFAATKPDVIDDVIRMSKAGVGDETILTFVQKSDAAVDVTADDVIAMTDANVSRTVIKAVVDQSRTTGSWRERRPAASSSTVVVEPLVTRGYWYDPWYDPYFYGGYGYYGYPRVSIGLGLGFGGYYYGGRSYSYGYSRGHYSYPHGGGHSTGHSGGSHGGSGHHR